MRNILKQAAAVAALTSVLFALQLLAFTEPSTAPPGGNVEAPLNTGGTGQAKIGGLLLGSGCTGSCVYGLVVQNGHLNVANGKVMEGGNPLIPSGAIMYFNLSSCPAGWSTIPNTQGRYIVGLNPGGTLGGTDGTALGNLEDRPTGSHNHPISDPGHTHPYSATGQNPARSGGSDLYATPSVGGQTGPAATNISVLPPTGSVAGTNAPYIQFLVCQKN